MLTTQLDRREALARIAAIFGSALVAPLGQAIAAGVDPGMGPRNAVFSDAQRALLDALCERIIPTTDTPGARDAGVTDYVEMIVDEYFDAVEREGFLTDLAAIDARASGTHGKNFSMLDPEHQDAIVTATEKRQLDGVSASFFPTLKQLTVTGYYTSEIGMTVEQLYLPVPGRYDGAYLYAKVGKLFTF